MIGTGLPLPGASPMMAPAAPFTIPSPTGAAQGPAINAAGPQAPRTLNMGGIMSMGNVAHALQMGKDDSSAFHAQQDQPVISGLAGHIRNFWTQAKTGKLQVEQRMIEALLARRGEYTPAKLQQIQEQRQPPIYMMLGASKMRQVESLMRDVVIGSGAEKPWTLSPSPVPDIPQSLVQSAIQQLQQEIMQAMQSGFPPSQDAARQRMLEIKEEMAPMIMEAARQRCDLMESKMEDQLVEGGYLEALDQFLTDLSTFPTAFVAGPIIRNKPKLSWGPDDQLVVKTALTLEWERVDPFDMFPAPWAMNLNKSPLIRLNHLTRENLNEMLGVEGFSEPAIREILKRFATKGLREWQSVQTQKNVAEGKTTANTLDNGLIDALQYWGSASGQSLLDWGMTKDQVPDPTKEYQIEAWMVENIVFKAVLNADPLARRPYYGASFQMVPGSVWGNSPYDLMHDCQDMCNAAARALAANMGVSSGPQVSILSNRLPAGEDVTEMYPWKIWQFESDPMGSTAPPISFFQPSSNAQELMMVYDRFSALADECTGIPRYMAGFDSGGAGRTASGMSMMIGNASKVIKQVLGTVDTYIIDAMLDRLFYYNMRYGDDPDLKGDVNIVPRGAASLVTKEAAQVRTNEFLQATANPIDMQIIGLDGRAELLRSSAKTLDINADRVVPPRAVIKMREAAAQQQAAAAQQQALAQQQNANINLGAPPQIAGPGGPPPTPSTPGQQLMNGAPATNHFSPAPGAPNG